MLIDSHSRILLLTSNPVHDNYLKAFLRHFESEVYSAQKLDEGLKIVKEKSPQLIVLDSSLKGLHWSEAASNLKKVSQEADILLLTPLTIREGSADPNIDSVIRVPFNYVELRNKIASYLQKGNVENKPEGESILCSGNDDIDYIEGLILGRCRRIAEVKNIIRRVAEPEVTVLLRGESGTGKELAAQALHRCSKRRNKPFVKVLCAAIPEGLLESELFGHEKGAFTGAHRSKPGKFEFANGGTIFLDEIGDIPQSLQVKLLQVLQDGEFSKIGGKEIKVDVRVIAATNKNLERNVATGIFREDLFYRLNVVSVTMPPLRDRKEDIPLLTEFFLHKYCQLYNKDYCPLSEEAIDRFIAYKWPGNVRELENVVKRIIVLGSEKIILDGHSSGQSHVDEQIQDSGQMRAADVNAAITGAKTFEKCNLREIAQEAVKNAEKEVIKGALEACKWNKRKAAELLSISYKTLFYKMRQYNLLE